MVHLFTTFLAQCDSCSELSNVFHGGNHAYVQLDPSVTPQPFCSQAVQVPLWLACIILVIS